MPLVAKNNRQWITKNSFVDTPVSKQKQKSIDNRKTINASQFSRGDWNRTSDLTPPRRAL